MQPLGAALSRSVGRPPMLPSATDRLLHCASGLLVSPSTGELWSTCGRTVGRRYRDGYIRVIHRRAGGSCTTWYAHRLVWEAVHGPVPKRMEVDHLDGDASNNRLDNLQLVTGSENRRLQRARNIAKFGSPSSQCKLSVAEVEAVLRTVGIVPTKVWARRYGVNSSTIRCIRKKKTWRHVDAGTTCRAKRPKRG
ncbi:TPA: HNH endonuclease signature motif containing protein [Stenotrophomonas maltophilia]